MAQSISLEEKLAEPVSTPINCSGCGNEAVMRMLRIDIPGEQSQILNTYICDPCMIRDSVLIPVYDQNPRGGIKIGCSFSSIDELDRFVTIVQHSSIRMEKGSFFYECVSVNDYSCCVEHLVRHAIEDLTLSWNIPWNGSVSDLNVNETEAAPYLSAKPKLSSSSLSSLAGSSSASSVSSKDEAVAALDILVDFLRTGIFKMEITDKSGFSRICPKGKRLVEMKMDKLEDFNDSEVSHEWFKR